MAKTNFSVAVDEDNVKDFQATEWRIIQEAGYGESNKEIAMTFLVRRNRAQLLINDFGEIKPTVERSGSLVGQTGVTGRDFLKEIQNEIEAKASCWGSASLTLLCERGFIR